MTILQPYLDEIKELSDRLALRPDTYYANSVFAKSLRQTNSTYVAAMVGDTLRSMAAQEAEKMPLPRLPSCVTIHAPVTVNA